MDWLKDPLIARLPFIRSLLLVHYYNLANTLNILSLYSGHSTQRWSKRCSPKEKKKKKESYATKKITSPLMSGVTFQSNKKIARNLGLTCCVFQLAFGCCAHPKAGRTTFFQQFSTFFVHFKPFSVIS